MTAPLPLNYGRGRSLVDRTRIRWAGAGGIVLGLLFLAAQGIDTTIFGLLFLALGVATWVVTRFGTRHFSQLTPVSKAIVVAGTLGFLFLALFYLLWIIINKMVDGMTKTSPPSA